MDSNKKKTCHKFPPTPKKKKQKNGNFLGDKHWTSLFLSLFSPTHYVCERVPKNPTGAFLLHLTMSLAGPGHVTRGESSIGPMDGDPRAFRTECFRGGRGGEKKGASINLPQLLGIFEVGLVGGFGRTLHDCFFLPLYQRL